MDFDRILVLGPHVDDGETGCGGLISRFKEEGRMVWYATFSFAGKSLPSGYPPLSTQEESYRAAEVLGIGQNQLISFDFEVRDFPLHRQKILEEMIKLRQQIAPNIVVLPSTYDTHQDHKVISDEGFRAFKMSTILGYEILQNNLNFPTNVFVKIEHHHLMQKIKAVECYESQKWRGGLGAISALAHIRGRQIGVDYAECFEAIRWII